MRTLIFNGSPRPKGDTASLLRLLTPRLTGEVTVLDAYGSQISPCIDCRHCWTAADCVLRDGMQTVYDELQRCDNVLIASPLHYAQLTAPLLGIGSRLQIYFCAGKFRGERLIQKPKRGGVILVGGGTGDPAGAFHTAEILLHDMNCQQIHPLICSHDTDNLPAREDPKALAGLTSLADFFNRAPGT